MKILIEVVYFLDMNEYEVGVDNFYGDKDVIGEDCDEFERDFCNGVEENGEILVDDDDEEEDSDVYWQLVQKDKDFFLVVELGKVFLEKNEEFSQKYELL